MSNEERIVQWIKIGLGIIAISLFAYFLMK